MSLMRNDLVAIKTDIGLVRTRCEEIHKICKRLEKENEKLSSSMQDANADVKRCLMRTSKTEMTLEKCL